MRKNNLYIFILILLSSNLLIAQHSYIVQLKRNIALVDKNQSELRSSSSSLVSSIKQIAVEPLNLWEISLTREFSNSYIKDVIFKNAEVILVQKNRKFKNRFTPNDSLYSRQWQYENKGNNGVVGADIDADKAWDITIGGKTSNGDQIVVAVIDDGLNLDHPDLISNLWVNKNEIPNNKIDDDGNGYIDDYRGWNVKDLNDQVTEDASHGTPVAGVIGARGNNGIGVTGVNWDVKLMPIFYGTTTESNALASYSYIYKQRKLYNETNGAKGAFIVATNASWGIDGGKAEEAQLWCSIFDSLGSVGVLNAGATANNDVNVDKVGDLPTSCESEFLISVTNITKQNNRSIAGYGEKSIDLGAYGEGAFTLTKSGYGTFGGTSCATPHVAGAIALLYSIKCDEFSSLIKDNPLRAALLVKDAILTSTKPLDATANITTTGGILNLYNAVSMLSKDYCNSCRPILAVKSKSEFNGFSVSWEKSTANKQFRYRKVEDKNWIEIAGNTSDELMIDNLDLCSEYVYQYRSICSRDTSRWSYSKYVKTIGCCNAPASITSTLKDDVLELSSSSSNKYKIALYNPITKKEDTIQFVNNTSIKLSDCTQYVLRAAEFCSAQNKFSAFGKEILQYSKCGECTKDYCAPGNYENLDEWIESVSVNNQNYVSGKSTKGYAQHIGAIIPKLVKNDSVTMQVNPGFSSSEYREHYSVFVDWNGNKSFESNEEIFKTKESTRESVNFKFKVPDSAKLGLSRMRVIMSFSASQAGCNANGEYGETEDYCVDITQTVSTKDEDDSNIKLSPNPNRGSFIVESDFNVNEYTINNNQGILISKKQIVNSKSISVQESLPAGMYNIHLINGEKISTKKFIVHE
jgi:serine protease